MRICASEQDYWGTNSLIDCKKNSSLPFSSYNQAVDLNVDNSTSLFHNSECQYVVVLGEALDL